MAENDPFPIFDYNAAGFPPRPEKRPIPGCGPYDPVPPPDPKYEQQIDDWKASFTPAQQAAYQAHCEASNGWFTRRREEIEDIERTGYEQLGMEYGVNTPKEYDTARNMNLLLSGIAGVKRAIEALEANEQFGSFFNPPNE